MSTTMEYIASYDNFKSDSLSLVKQHLSHEWHYSCGNQQRKREILKHRVYGYRKGTAVSSIEVFESSRGTLTFSKTKQIHGNETTTD